MIPIIHFYYMPSPAMIKSGLKTDLGIYTKGKRGKYLPKALIIGAPKCGNYIFVTSIYHFLIFFNQRKHWAQRIPRRSSWNCCNASWRTELF
jgi:hypothetical protein